MVLHVGTPKSGTTFLQRALWAHREPLRALGVELPGARPQEMFHAAVEVREAQDFWGLDADRLAGTWQRLCEQARALPATTVMSHELLAAATQAQAGRALSALEGAEVHVVLTVRDLARQLTSEWQERLKNGSTRSFRSFEEHVCTQLQAGDLRSGFWRFQDVLGVLDRWTAGLPPSRVHVVVAPPAGSAPEVLWHRYAAAVGFPGERLDPTATGAARSNQTLGVVQAALLRQVNLALGGRVEQPQYARVVKRQFAQSILAAQVSDKPVCPASLVAQLRPLVDAQREALAMRGYQVHGDLAELVPGPVAPAVPHPDDVAQADLAQAAATALAELLVERSGRQERRAAPTAAPASAPASAPPEGRTGWRRQAADRLRGTLRR